MTTKLYSHLIKDTGIRVMVRKVSQMLIKEAVKDFVPPQPPLNKVVLDGKEELEPNAADPAYRVALQDYNLKVIEAGNAVLIKWGVVYTLTEEDRAQVAELKATWAEDHDKPLEGSDKFIFVNYIAVGSQEDYIELRDAITRRTQATPEATQEALGSFPG